MNNNVSPEVDPLSSYNLSTFHNFESYDNLQYGDHGVFPYPVKLEQYQNAFNYYNNSTPSVVKGSQESTKNDNEPNKEIESKVVNNVENKTQKVEDDHKPDVTKAGRQKIKKERSKYFSEKITEKDFPFYGCSLCNISYQSLHELDTHVLIHKERVTSYDLRIKNQLKKRKLKKEMKKNKKLKKSIKIESQIEVEIKPEDGYIGNEKASDFVNNTESDNQSSKENNGNIKTSNQLKATTDKNNQLVAKSSTENTKDEELQKIYKCFACQKQFTLSYYLKLHVRSHTDEKPYTCSSCGQSFITASKLGRHNKRFHLAIRYQCRICYRYFSRFEFLTRHFDKKHPDDKLEGEPYDYNAILPYLKELEEQMQEKNEIEKEKPKPEDVWAECDVVPKENIVKQEEHVSNCTIEIEEVKVDMDIEVKQEEVDYERNDDFSGDCDGVGGDNFISDDIGGDDGKSDEVKGDDVKEEDDATKDDITSDDDYFPSNTWAATPKIEPPPSPKTKQDRLKCPICEKKVSTVSYMRVHMRTHTGEKPFKCYICNAGFITSSKMHRHVLTHPESWNDDGVKPEKEEIKSETEKDGDDDDDDDNKKDKKAIKKMKKALAKFSKKPNDLEKKKKLYQKRPHSCEFCHKRFLHLETLQVHKKSHEGEERVYKCNFCLQEVEDETALKSHEMTHEGPKPYLCTVCGKSYKKRETMIYHRKNHKPEKEFICDICTKSFNAQCKLQRHIVSHRVDKFILRYECPVCAHMFNTKYHVQMHLSTHQKEGLIQEENRNEILAMVLQNARKIPKKSDTSSSLTDIVPADERSRVCNICGEVFQHFYYLEEHLKSHGSKIAIEDSEKIEEKKHICKICNKGFKLHYYLKLHSFTHTKEKPFICQQCGKGFITRGKLKRHLETHTGLKKYQCHICYKFFTRPSYLRIHVRTIHGTQDYNFRLDKNYGFSIPVMQDG